MKVAIVVHRFPQLSETFILNQITAMLDAGIDVQIFSYYQADPSQKLHPQFEEYGLEDRIHYGVYLPTGRAAKYINFVQLLLEIAKGKYRKTILNALNYFKYGKEILNLQLFYRALLFNKLHNFDVIHCHFGPIGYDVVQLRNMGIVRGKVITSFHGYDFQNQDILKLYQDYKKLFKCGDGFVANSSFTKNKLLSLGCPSTKLRVIPVSAASKIFDSLTNRSTEQYGMYTILTIARLEEVKGIKYAIRAMSLIKEASSINFVYNIIGSGSLETELKELVNSLQLTRIVHFLGSKSQDEVKEALINSDVLLLTSITTKAGASETQGLVLIEAQAAGIPVVASRSGGISDSLIEGETGLLVTEKKVNEIAEALIRLYKNPEARYRMGSRGQKFVKENFDQTVLSEKLTSFYKNIIGL